MPQMMPMHWILIYLIGLTVLCLIMIIMKSNYFFFFLSEKNLSEETNEMW